ncbi:uncharacterized protein V6R79_020381 [Siganus canaliculatus]
MKTGRIGTGAESIQTKRDVPFSGGERARWSGMGGVCLKVKVKNPHSVKCSETQIPREMQPSTRKRLFARNATASDARRSSFDEEVPQ